MPQSLSLILTATVTHAYDGAQTSSVATASADEAHGYRIAPDDDDDAGRMILRGLFFVPRAITTVAFAPIRGGLWLVEEYEVPEHLIDFFYNDSRTFGLYPTVFVETGFGFNAGARMIVRDVLADGTRFRLSAGYGGRFRQRYRADLRTGELITDWLELGVEGRYEDMPTERFFGLGATSPDIESRYQRKRGQAVGFAKIKSLDILRFTLSGLYSTSNLEQSPDYPDAPIEAIGGPDVDVAYQELFVEIDTRRPANDMIFETTPSTGIYLAGSVGLTEVLNADVSPYWRWSADGQWLIDLLHGNRVLALRLYLESVMGPLSEVPVLELPRLGGPELLRGYERDRFRDRALMLASVEYRFPISAHSLGYVFVDGGRVFRSLEDFEFRHWGLGFGGGVEIFTKTANLVRLQAGGSKDGSFLFNFVFGADFDHEPRSER